MTITRAIAQLRTTNLDASIRFYVERLGMKLDFRHKDFYAGIDADGQAFHLKRVDEPDPSVADVREGGHFHLYFDTDDVATLAHSFERRGVRPVAGLHDTPWGTREFVVEDDQGHTLYFGQALAHTGTSRRSTMNSQPARFETRSLIGAEFRDVNLADARFDDVNLAGATFTNISLIGARLKDVNLRNVAITDASIEGMTINGILVADLLPPEGNANR